MKTVLRLSIVVVLSGLFLGGCGCFQQAMKGETPPPPAPVAKPAPAPVCPACPPAVVCPPAPACPPAVVCPPAKVCPTCPEPAKKDRN